MRLVSVMEVWRGVVSSVAIVFTICVGIPAAQAGVSNPDVFVDTPEGDCLPVSDALVAWWPGDGTPYDIVGDNHGVMIEGATFADGLVDEAFSLDGVDAGIIIDTPSTSAALDFAAGQDFSIEAWVRAEPMPGLVRTILGKRFVPFGGAAVGYELYLVNGRLALQLATPPIGLGNYSNYVSSGPDLRDSRFHHVAVVVDRDHTSGGKLFVDGEVVRVFNPTRHSGDLSNSDPFRIGLHPTPVHDHGHLHGLIDEIAVYNRALTDAEMAAIFEAGAAGKCKADRMESFDVALARVTFVRDAADSFRLAGSLEPSEGGDGIHLLDEQVTIGIGSIALTIPAGSFSLEYPRYSFNGTVGDADIVAVFQEGDDGSWVFGLVVKSIDLSGTANPVLLSLTIGDDRGEATEELEGRLRYGDGEIIEGGLPANGPAEIELP